MTKPWNGWNSMDTAPRTGERVTLYVAGRGTFEGWWHSDFAGSEAYWMDDQDSEPDPVAWQKLLPGPFERTEAALCTVCESTVSEGYDMTIGLEEFFKELGEPDYKLQRLSHGAEPWHYWSRESIEAACNKLSQNCEASGSLKSSSQVKQQAEVMEEAKPRTLAEELKAEEQALHRRLVHHTRPAGPLSLDEAISLNERMGPSAPKEGEPRTAVWIKP